MAELVYYPENRFSRSVDPAKCDHRAPRPFIGTVFVDNKYHHRIVQLRRCVKCGRVFETERDVRSAGLRNSVEVDDPRVMRTLLYNRSVDERFYKHLNDGRCDFSQGADLS